MKTREEILEKLEYYRGSEHLYPLSPFVPVSGTDGIKFVMDSCEAYWLMIDIAIFAWEIHRVATGTTTIEQLKNDLLTDSESSTSIDVDEISPGLADMQFWELKVIDGVGELTLRADSDEPVTLRHTYNTDFPLEGIRVWTSRSREGLTMYLPSEY